MTKHYINYPYVYRKYTKDCSSVVPQIEKRYPSLEEAIKDNPPITPDNLIIFDDDCLSWEQFSSDTWEVWLNYGDESLKISDWLSAIIPTDVVEQITYDFTP